MALALAGAFSLEQRFGPLPSRQAGGDSQPCTVAVAVTVLSVRRDAPLEPQPRRNVDHTGTRFVSEALIGVRPTSAERPRSFRVERSHYRRGIGRGLFVHLMIADLNC